MMRIYIILFILLPCSLFAQQIHYDFSAPNAAHHEAEITVTVSGVKRPGPLIFRMSRSSPGRYSTHEFGKNVYKVSARDGSGKNLAVTKVDAEVYQVPNNTGTVKLTYTLFANHADGTYASIDRSGYHLNMPAVFMWVKGLEKSPITLRFKDVATSWKVVTQLKPTSDAYTFGAPHLQYFMDAPTKVGKFYLREWKVANPDGKQYTIRLALEADASEKLVDTFASKVQTLVKEAQAVYGELPAFDYGTYTFISSINPYVIGDGMEHRNSTMITDQADFSNSNDFLTTFAHEFFHCWNVERIRPKSLEPFNFEKSNMSEALWIAEGFTQYYGSLLMKRAGLISESDFVMQMSGLINAKENTPGGKYYTPIENSQRAVFVDAGVANDKTNYPNIFTTYYFYGGALALALDLQLRQQPGKSLDGFMQRLWKVFGKPEKPYTLPEVQQVLAAYTTPVFASGFFKDHVYGHTAINYNGLLESAGLSLAKVSAGAAWIGNVRYGQDTTRIIITSSTTRDSPLYTAGVDQGDEILQLGGVHVTHRRQIDSILRQHQPGETVKLVYSHRGHSIETDLQLGENPYVTIQPIEASGASLTELQKKFRREWFDPKSNHGF